MMYAAGGGQHGSAAGGEGESDQSVACNRQRSFLVGGDLHNASLAGQRGGDVEIAVNVKGQPLRPAQSAIEDVHGAVHVNAVDGIEAGGRGAGDKKRAIGMEGEMVGGDAGFQRGKDKNLPVAGNLENGSAAVAYVEIFFAIEGNAGGDAHAF